MFAGASLANQFSLKTCSYSQIVRLICSFPRQFQITSSKVTVSSSRKVNWFHKIKHFDETFWAQLEMLANEGNYFFCAYFASAERVDPN
jgi:hypothetical protein